MTTQSGQIAHRWLASLAVFKKAPMLSYFPLSPGFQLFFFLEQTPEAVWTHTKIGLMQHVC